MLELKQYQQHALDALQAYFRLTNRLNDADLAYYHFTRESTGRGIPYQPVCELPGLPYVCLRIPTGGGKTLVASHAIGIAARDLLHADHPLVLWLAPSNVIRDQTLRALADPNHPYRQAVESQLGAVTVMSISDALYVQPVTLNSSTTIIVATIQAFRVDNTEGRKVYESSGSLMPHFSDLPAELQAGLEMANGIPKKSLANVLYLRRPIVIVDEAHNARTPLSFDTLARFHPSCILEFSATPATAGNPSNVLHSTSAAELKAEAMIKMPIRLKVRPQWKELLSDAIAQRERLEAAAKLEQRSTGEYLRPIMLLQAQPRSQSRETITVDMVRQTLLDDFKIPENHIARATGEVDEIGDADLSKPDSPIRYVITVQALREGWDCPSAYVLCSVAESRSSTAVEQILGRILRMPKARRKESAALNLAYAFVSSENFGQVANQLQDQLVNNMGFERYEARAMIDTTYEQERLPLLDALPGPLEEPVRAAVTERPAIEDLPASMLTKVHFNEADHTLVVTERLDPEEGELLIAMSPPADQAAVRQIVEKATHSYGQGKAASPAERGEVLSIPQLVVRRGQQLELFEETAFLDHDFDLARCDSSLSSAEYAGVSQGAAEIEYDLTDEGKLKKDFVPALQHTMTLFATDQGWTPAELVYWLDRHIPHPDVRFREANAFLSNLVIHLQTERGFTLDELVTDKYHLREAVAAKIDSYRQAARLQAYQRMLSPDFPAPVEVNPGVCFTFPRDDYPYNSLYRGAYPFQKHYYAVVGDLQDKGEEFDCAVFLDGLSEVKFWVRNLERRPAHSFWLQTSTDRFYPDFVCLLQDGCYLVVEYKGDHLWGNPDSIEKRLIGDVWARRSGGQCLFVMPKGRRFDEITAAVRGA